MRRRKAPRPRTVRSSRASAYRDDRRAAKNIAHYKVPLGKHQGPRRGRRLLVQRRRRILAQVNITEDGNVVVTTGHPDVGGSRAAIANITAELLGIDYKKRLGADRRHQRHRLSAT
jgi:hypothetical protein